MSNSTPMTSATWLQRLRDDIEIDSDGSCARVAGHEIVAGSPQELRRDLGSALYEAFHVGHRTDDAKVPFNLRDPEVEQRLRTCVPHRHARRLLAWCGAVSDDGADRVLVLRDQVRVWVDRRSVASPLPAEAGDSVLVDLPACRPAASPGFFLVLGSAPFDTPDALVRVYFHLRHVDGAVDAWERILAWLEDAGIAYQAKIVSNPALYPRRDALVVYLAPEHEGAAASLAGLVGDVSAVGDTTSRFARRMGPGVATAWEPADPRPELQGLSFGEHRSVVIAAASVRSALHGTPWLDEVTAELEGANIDADDPSRNRTFERRRQPDQPAPMASATRAVRAARRGHRHPVPPVR